MWAITSRRFFSSASCLSLRKAQAHRWQSANRKQHHGQRLPLGRNAECCASWHEARLVFEKAASPCVWRTTWREPRGRNLAGADRGDGFSKVQDISIGTTPMARCPVSCSSSGSGSVPGTGSFDNDDDETKVSVPSTFAPCSVPKLFRFLLLPPPPNKAARSERERETERQNKQERSRLAMEDLNLTSPQQLAYDSVRNILAAPPGDFLETSPIPSLVKLEWTAPAATATATATSTSTATAATSASLGPAAAARPLPALVVARAAILPGAEAVVLQDDDDAEVVTIVKSWRGSRRRNRRCWNGRT
jgi:hypothetical protein